MEELDLSFELTARLSQAAMDQFWDEFIEQVIESQNLVFGCGGDTSVSGVIGLGANDSITSKHQTAISEWLKRRPEVRSFNIEPL